jgi:hypothetical protein
MDERSRSSAETSSVRAGMYGLSVEQARDEKQYGEVDVVLLFIESARKRAERAASELRASGAEDFLVEALERSQQELSETAKKLIQGTFFAVPDSQLRL